MDKSTRSLVLSFGEVSNIIHMKRYALLIALSLAALSTHTLHAGVFYSMDTINLYTVNTTNAQATVVAAASLTNGPSGTSLGNTLDLTYNPADQKLYGIFTLIGGVIGTKYLGSINTSTAAITLGPTINEPQISPPIAPAFDGSGNLFIGTGSPTFMNSVNLSTGALTPIGSAPPQGAFAWDSSNNRLLLASGNLDFASVNTSTAATSAIATIAGQPTPLSLVVTELGAIYGIAFGSSNITTPILFSYNLAGPSATSIGAVQGAIQGSTRTALSVLGYVPNTGALAPEPATTGLIAIGALALFAFRKRLQ